MELLNGYKIGSLPIDIENLTRVSDLMSYEGPILSHFVDSKGLNFLYYWVDYDENFNRWLIWKITKNQLYDYLRSQSSLHEILLDCNKDYIYSVDIDQNLIYHNIQALEFDQLIGEYIPEIESYYRFDVPKVYDSLFNEFDVNPYLQLQRETALYFKLTPTNLKFGTAVTATGASEFLKKISESFLNYLQFDFFESFKSDYGDLKKLNKIINQFKEILQYRIVDTAYSSFQVGLSSDSVNTVEGSAFKDWQKSILEKYKNDVIDVDYTSDEDLLIISQKFPDAAIRKDIYQPIVDIINNKQYKTEVVNYHKTLKRKYNTISRKNTEILMPTPLEELEISNQVEHKKLLTVILELNDNEDIATIGKKALQQNTLFSQENNNVEISFPEIEEGETKIVFKTPFKCVLTIHDNEYIITSTFPPISIASDKKDEVFSKFKSAIIELYSNIYKDDIEELSEDQVNYKELVKTFSTT